MGSSIMLYYSLIIFLLLQFGYSNGEIFNRGGREIVIENVADLSVFYDLNDNHVIKDMMPRPWIRPGQSLRLPFSAGPCSCQGLGCGCCAGIKITQLNFDRKICTNLSYSEEEFGVVFEVTVNDKRVIHNVFSAKNPPPICIPVPIGGIPGIDFCIRLFDIRTVDLRKIHICMDWELRIIMNPILILHFDCLLLGADGVSLVKPGEIADAEAPGPVEATTETSTDAGDVFDEVTEVKDAVTSVSEAPNLGDSMMALIGSDKNVTKSV